jgi:hypothetical protein
MSKVKESSWVELNLTITPEDIKEVEDAITELHWVSGITAGFLEHIVEQYYLKGGLVK